MSAIFALIAWIVQRHFRSAALANLLWGLVLVKMVTPPLLAIPVLEVPSVSGLSVQQDPPSSPQNSHLYVGLPEKPGRSTYSALPVIQTHDTQAPSLSSVPGSRSVIAGSIVWLVVSAILFAVSAVRIIRFHWLLKANSRVDHGLSSTLSSDVASQLSLGKYPSIVATSANIAPFVWWMTGRVVIVVSSRAIQELSENDLRLVITHEMAHIKRRDHWFRWLEWIALVVFWWNPVIWWARRQLRISEEMACDDLVLEQPVSAVHQYVNSLLNMAELLASSAIRPPVLASAINSGGSLEERLKMMMTGKSRKVPAFLRLAVVAVATCVLPLGFVYAQDIEAIERRLGGAVEDGELSLEQAQVMMDALRRSTGSPHLEAKKQRYRKFTDEIEAAVEAGRLSEEAAEEKLIAVRREMFEEHGERNAELDMEAKKQRYRKFTDEIEAAVEAGRLSEEAAEEKLIAVRREMFEERGERNAELDMEAKKQRYRKFADEIEAAVEAGRLSEEAAEEKLIAVRREMFEEHGERNAELDMEAKKQRYRKFTDEIEAAVEAGRLSEEAAEEKLIAVRREMFEERGERNAELDMEAKKQRYRKFADEIEAAVEAGRLSEEAAEEKLIAVRREMFEQDRSENDED